MRIQLKITAALLQQIRANLVRPHDFAAERVGFVSCRTAHLRLGGIIILAHDFLPVADSDYVKDPTVGALMGSEAIRKALQFAYGNDVGMFHVHMHDHCGQPRPSGTDLSETAKFVPDFWHVRPAMPHGAIIISRDSLSGRCWYPGHPKPTDISKVTLVGPRLIFIWS